MLSNKEDCRLSSSRTAPPYPCVALDTDLRGEWMGSSVIRGGIKQRAREGLVVIDRS